MSLSTSLEPREVTVFIDPELFRNFGKSVNASIDSIAAEALEHLPQYTDDAIQYVTSGVVSGAKVCVSACAPENIAAAVAENFDTSEQTAAESLKKMAQEGIEASIKSTADSSKSGVKQSTDFSANQADYSNRCLSEWF